MRPGHTTPNEFEIEILQHLATQDPAIRPFLSDLHVLSRKYTGVGCFIEFHNHAVDEHHETCDLALNATIVVPGVLHGLGAVLFPKNGRPDRLEIYTFGEEQWDGRSDGFSIKNA